MTSTTPKIRAELERRGLKRKLYNEDKAKPIDEGIKLKVEDANSDNVSYGKGITYAKYDEIIEMLHVS